MQTILVLDLIPLKLVAACPSSDGGRRGRSGNIGYQYAMRYRIEGSCQVDGHTHCTRRCFPPVKDYLDVCAKLEEGRYS